MQLNKYELRLCTEKRDNRRDKKEKRREGQRLREGKGARNDTTTDKT